MNLFPPPFLLVQYISELFFTKDVQTLAHPDRPDGDGEVFLRTYVQARMNRALTVIYFSRKGWGLVFRSSS